jgi:hypothetical protein
MGNDDAMKKLAMWLLLMPAALMAQPQEQSLTINAKIPCNNLDVVLFNLKEWEEVPVAQAKAAIKTETTVLGGNVITFINPETLSFTIILKIGEGEESMACIMLAGEEFGPVFDTELSGDVKL